MNTNETTVQHETGRAHQEVSEVLGSTAATNLCVFDPEASGLNQMPQTD